jgi:hypothetical protein
MKNVVGFCNYPLNARIPVRFCKNIHDKYVQRVPRLVVYAKSSQGLATPALMKITQLHD